MTCTQRGTGLQTAQSCLGCLQWWFSSDWLSIISTCWWWLLVQLPSIISPCQITSQPRPQLLISLEFLTLSFYLFQSYNLALNTGSAVWILMAMASCPCTNWNISTQSKSLKWKLLASRQWYLRTVFVR